MDKPKKVYLLYPPITKKERYSSSVGSVGGEQIPLGIYYIAAYLRQNGYDVFAVDAEARKLTEEAIAGEIGQIRPDFVGISSTTVAFHRALEVAARIKRDYPELPVVLGGPHVTSNVEHSLSFDSFDYGVIGEGEITALELFNALSGHGRIAGIDGLAYRDGTGKVIVNKRRKFIDDLDMLPFPAYDLIPDLSLYTPPPSNYKTLPVMNMITSRGCPNLCTFCDRNIFGRKYRERSARNVYEEIKYLQDKYHVREIAFVDDTFLINKQRIYQLFELLNREGRRLHWTCMARINNVTFEFLKFLRKSGCWNIAFGIESGDEEILRAIKKNISLGDVSQVIDWCNTLKIKTKGFFIVGHPLETVETIDRTIRLACRLKLDAVVVTINTPIPGSQQYAEAAKYGTLDTTDWSKFNYWRPVFVPKGLTENILLEKQKKFYLKFYLRPRNIFNYLLSFLGRGGFRRFKAIVRLFPYLLPMNRQRTRDCAESEKL